MAASGHGDSHGNTPAAWTGVTIAFIGFLISGIALPFSIMPVFWGGFVVALIGGVVGWVMAKAGLGQPPHSMAKPSTAKPSVAKPSAAAEPVAESH